MEQEGRVAERKRILFVCVHNSARSQMAEGLVKALYADRFQAFSGGTKPTAVHPAAVRAMAEMGIDISGQRSKSIDEFLDQPFDYVVMVCDDSQLDCPFFPGGKEYVSHAFPDPAACRGTNEEVMACFRKSRDEIRAWIEEFFVKGRSAPAFDPRAAARRTHRGVRMAEILELSVDKFVFRFPADLVYSDAGVWVRFEGNGARIGLSDYIQVRNGDVTFVELRPEGTSVRAGDEIGTVETIKANLSVPSPVSGTVAAVNPALEMSPELVNMDPYGGGWLAVIEISDGDSARPGLKPAADHLEAVRVQAEAEVIR